ncbi:uncharacterized protein LOC111029948 [Myzus persicae]|uniref:uncharacterized protein LOC111029948 n=1 Tax=Myzus persicae TaxID=13164 RepID=UPI000B9324C3|nr:uncharacterized protein LOC111029948 [Myzus persicae]XP_022164900.1 uncharacterized protein LOC111029948 [Myzus persicae]XP_022164901.1 uncharacterized protein LOC111029948 [Myzus persicae]XP_022164902.1 uncharacterized protein LOC111029948 [Myzus persicae]
MQRPAAEGLDHDDDVDCDWPMCENVLRSLFEDVRPTSAAPAESVDSDAVASDVQRCLAEQIAPTAEMMQRLRLRLLLRRWSENGGEAATAVVVESKRMQVRLMTLPSAYEADSEYYALEAAYVSRTVEELSSEPWAAKPPANGYTYTLGTVHNDSETRACHLHGFTDPRARVTVDCVLLTTVLPRHRSTVKMYSTLRWPSADDPGPPVLVPHHFQVFSRDVLFR